MKNQVIVKKHPGGRPLKIQDASKLQGLADEYFRKCDEEKTPYTITGLAISLGFNSRQQISEYEDRSEFSDVIKRARLKVEHAVEHKLFTNNPTGSIFWLKNYGWKDKQEVELSGDITLSARVAEARKRLKSGNSE